MTDPASPDVQNVAASAPVQISASPPKPSSPAKSSSPPKPSSPASVGSAGKSRTPPLASSPGAPTAPAYAEIPQEPLPEDGLVEIDDEDSAYGGDDSQSETTSIASSMYRGYIENGRRYQTVREDKYWGPSDEQQFETFEAGHLVYQILDCQEENTLFRSPIPANAQHIIDLGTGDGTWAVQVADRFPGITVHGVDLYPPPVTWVPPNCIFEVDDITQDWTWNNKFDLIHLRLLLGAFKQDEWAKLYRQCYDNLQPGGWIEQVELDVRVMSDDGSLKPDSLLAGWGQTFLDCASDAGRPLNTQTTMRDSIAAAGFTEIREKLYKCPIGEWPKHPVYKDAGRVNAVHWKSGLEGWAMWLLTKHGRPTPWSADEVRVYVAKVRRELTEGAAVGLHIYHFTRRVWARKPLNAA
ncbi:hypothetical protein VE01_03534 [Pseudogymnoascus verrucosus]|uniref:Methyltransferase domain-containing protein n=1 Tax=Pseudogymnoascus verrucosus TaxID=342668 RepID=A0A1B8GRL3_9PEZI|nr:uncharacterized protein VE01_03534 [Pseudogymnoascus verrucosus]OBT98479.1 hypothetical protein VE01_03534 [Pseudogymnoascus verrucosus]